MAVLKSKELGVFEYIERERTAISIKDGQLVFNDNGYWIGINGLDTHEKILKWVAHLVEKKWMDNQLIRLFILKAADYHDLDIYGVSHE